MNAQQAQKAINADGFNVGFKVHAMSGGYVALSHNGKQIAAWITPEQAVETAHALAMPSAEDAQS